MGNIVNHKITGYFVLCILLLLSAMGCQREPQKIVDSDASPVGASLSVVEAPEAGVSLVGDGILAETTTLAMVADGHEPTRSDQFSGNELVFRVTFHDNGYGVVYFARIGGEYHLVYNGRVGRTIEGIDQIRFSPDGGGLAYSAKVDGKWRMVIDDSLGVEAQEVGVPVFSPDGVHLAYRGRDGRKHFMALDGSMIISEWRFRDDPVFSADSKRIAFAKYIDDKGRLQLTISDLNFNSIDIKPDAGSLLAANADRTRLASVTSHDGGGQRVIEFSFENPQKVRQGNSYDEITDLGFGPDGSSIAYVAKKHGKQYVVLNGLEESLDGGLPAEPIVVRPGNAGVGMIMASGGKYFLHEAFSSNAEESQSYDQARHLTYSDDGITHAYAARRGDKWFIVINGKEGPSFDMAVTPAFSPDGRHLVYRVRDEGKRFVVVADARGKVLREHPAYEMVFKPVFTPDGKSIAYGVKDGKKLVWKVESLY